MSIMNVLLQRLCSGACVFALCGAVLAEDGKMPEAAPVEQTVLAPSGEMVQMRWGVLGHNEAQEDWNGSPSRKRVPFFWDVEGQEPDSALIPLTHAFPLRMVRFHSGNNLNWREVVGPVAERKAPLGHYKDQLNAYPALEEYLGWMQNLPSGPQVSLIASPLRPVAEVADLVAYCNAVEGPMADLRVRNGHPQPYNVMIWELGNETDWEKREDLNLMRSDTAKEKTERMPVEEYIALCHERIAAMRKVDPEIKIYAHVKTAPWTRQNPDWPKWHRAVLKELAVEIDGVAVHPYYDGYPVDEVYRLTIDPIIADLRAASTPEHQLTLWISEHSKWIDYKERKNWPQSWGINGAVSAADFLMQAMCRPEIEYANYWSYGHNGPWRVLSREEGSNGKQEVKPTAIFQLFKLLNRAALDVVQPISISPNPDGVLNALAFYSGVKHSLLVCNRSEDKAIEFNIPGFNAQTALQILVSNPASVEGSAEYTQSIITPEQGMVSIPPLSVAAWLWEE